MSSSCNGNNESAAAAAATTTSSSSSLISRIIFRSVQPTDVARCYAIESASYPEDEAASKSALQYRVSMLLLHCKHSQ